MNRPEEFEDDYLTKIEAYCDWVEKLAADRSMECNALTIKLEKFNNVDLGSVSICDIDHCSKPSENETDAGNLCEKHYDDYFQALDNASVC